MHIYTCIKYKRHDNQAYYCEIKQQYHRISTKSAQLPTRISDIKDYIIRYCMNILKTVLSCQVNASSVTQIIFAQFPSITF